MRAYTTFQHIALHVGSWDLAPGLLAFVVMTEPYVLLTGFWDQEQKYDFARRPC